MIVLDASVAVGWLLGETPPVPDIDDILATRQIVVPAHWIVEIGNATLKALRRKAVAPERLAVIERELSHLTITVEPPIAIRDMLPILQFSRTHGLTMYDGIYLHTALARQAELATLDKPMRAAASQLGIALQPA